MKPGDKVTYIKHGKQKHGMVKSYHPKLRHFVYVVYNCEGDWQNYQNYTAAATDIADLTEGWV